MLQLLHAFALEGHDWYQHLRVKRARTTKRSNLQASFAVPDNHKLQQHHNHKDISITAWRATKEQSCMMQLDKSGWSCMAGMCMSVSQRCCKAQQLGNGSPTEQHITASRGLHHNDRTRRSAIRSSRTLHTAARPGIYHRESLTTVGIALQKLPNNPPCDGKLATRIAHAAQIITK